MHTKSGGHVSSFTADSLRPVIVETGFCFPRNRLKATPTIGRGQEISRDFVGEIIKTLEKQHTKAQNPPIMEPYNREKGGS